MQPIRVLGIETSCDETAVAIVQKHDDKTQVLSEVLFSQIDLHQIYGGVVPEIAARDHLKRLAPLVDQALAKAQLQPKDISGIAYTAGPGLVGALMTGACFARSLAYAWDCAFYPVHHMQAHLLVPFLDTPDLQPPFVALLVSGGHTQIYHVKTFDDFELLGETLDDAAGEAFDKLAKMLDLPYPGGPSVAKKASEGVVKYDLPRPMCDRPGLDMSFSGLKTAGRLLIESLGSKGKLNEELPNVCASFQEAVVASLCYKIKRAVQQTDVKAVVVAGGVSANQRLRDQLDKLSKVQKKTFQVIYPRMSWCTDNGVMVAYAGLQAYEQGLFIRNHCQQPVAVRARWPLTDVIQNSENKGL